MAPTQIPLEDHKYFIYNLYIEQNKTLQQTLAAIHTLGIKCSRPTLVSRLKTWEFTKYLKSEDTPSLRVHLAYLFWIQCFNDEQILRVIHLIFIFQYLNMILIIYYV